MLLSVLSVLARVGVDPWLEAAELARLPEEAATLRLASFIAALPVAQTAHRDLRMTAARLIALLPHGTFISAPSRRTEASKKAANGSRSLIYMLFLSVAIVAFAIGARSIVPSHQPSAHSNSPLSDVSGADSSSTPIERARHQPQ
jgi:hypothetical protein